jgi:branched-chain amino acid transport system substrate-binding protein
MGWKKIAIVAEDTDYGSGLVTAVKNSAKNTELEIESIIYPKTSTDLTPMLLKIKAWKPDITINAGAPPSAYLVVKQANDIGLFPNTPMIASYNWCTLPEYWEALGEKGKYILFSEHFKKGMKTTFLGDWMVAKYHELHNEDPTYYAINAFGEILVIAQAINMAQSDNPKEIAEALVKWPYLDWSGVVDFKEEKGPWWHFVSAPLLMFQVTDVKQSFNETKLIWPFKFGGDGKVMSP